MRNVSKYARLPQKKYRLRLIFTKQKKAKGSYLDDRFNSFLDNNSHYTDMGKVIGEFVCDKVYLIKNQGNSFVVANEEQGVTNEIARQSCLEYDDMVGYLGNKDGYGLHITALKIYNKPKELSEFRPICKFEGKDLICNLCRTTNITAGCFLSVEGK